MCKKKSIYSLDCGSMRDMSNTKPRSIRELPSSFAMQTISLATSGFSLVAALAWNELIRTIIDQYIRPYLGRNSGLISLIAYAVVTTLIAVLVSMQLSSINERLDASRNKTQ